MSQRRRILAVLVAVGLTAFGIGTAVAADSAGPITGIGGKCADAAATRVQIRTCDGGAAQQWTVAADGSLRANGKCLDVAAASTADGAAVQTYACNGIGAQRWTATAGQLVNPASGKCLDAANRSSADGTPLQIWACSGGTNQQWKLPAAPPTSSPTPTVSPTTPPAAGPCPTGTTFGDPLPSPTRPPPRSRTASTSSRARPGTPRRRRCS